MYSHKLQVIVRPLEKMTFFETFSFDKCAFNDRLRFMNFQNKIIIGNPHHLFILLFLFTNTKKPKSKSNQKTLNFHFLLIWPWQAHLFMNFIQIRNHSFEFFKRYSSIFVFIAFEDCFVNNLLQLNIIQIVSNHHLQNLE